MDVGQEGQILFRQRFRETFHGVEYLLEIIHQIILSKNDSGND